MTNDGENGNGPTNWTLPLADITQAVDERLQGPSQEETVDYEEGELPVPDTDPQGSVVQTDSDDTKPHAVFPEAPETDEVEVNPFDQHVETQPGTQSIVALEFQKKLHDRIQQQKSDALDTLLEENFRPVYDVDENYDPETIFHNPVRFHQAEKDYALAVELEHYVTHAMVELAEFAADKEFLARHLQEQVERDELTGLYRRGHYDTKAPELVEQVLNTHAVKENPAIEVQLKEHDNKKMSRVGDKIFGIGYIIMDIDHFKKINDTYGHPAGDEIIRIVSRKMEKVVSRRSDLVCRYGGEEFVVLMPFENEVPYATIESRVCSVADSIRQQVRSAFPVKDRNDLPDSVTMSAGVNVYLPDRGELGQYLNTFTTNPEKKVSRNKLVREAVERLAKEADEALYRSKQTGRNRTTSSMELPAVTPELIEYQKEHGSFIADPQSEEEVKSSYVTPSVSSQPLGVPSLESFIKESGMTREEMVRHMHTVYDTMDDTDKEFLPPKADDSSFSVEEEQSVRGVFSNAYHATLGKLFKKD